MAFFPISHTVPQYVDTSGDPHSGAVLKAYSSGTLTNISMATDSAGGTTAATITLNADGYPAVSGTIITPYINEKYRLALFATQAAADANSSPIWDIDTVPIGSDLGAVTQNISTTTALTASDANNHIIVTGTNTITLPDVASAVGSGFVFTARNGGTGLVTFDGKDAETINGSLTILLFPGDSCIFTSSSTATDEWSTTGLEELRGVKAETGTTYTFISGDHDRLLTTSNAAAIAGTLPQAGAAFPDGWYTTVNNIGVGALTITPTTSTIDGNATLILATGDTARIDSDGTNYRSTLSSRGVDSTILTQVASSSANISFTANIDSNFKIHEFHLINVIPAADATLHMLLSTDGGSTYLTTAYRYHTDVSSSSSGTYSSLTSTSASQMVLSSAVEATSSEGYSAVIRLYDPGQASVDKIITSIGGNLRSSADLDKADMVGQRDGTTAAINAVRFIFSTGNVASGTFIHKGIR